MLPLEAPGTVQRWAVEVRPTGSDDDDRRAVIAWLRSLRGVRWAPDATPPPNVRRVHVPTLGAVWDGVTPPGVTPIGLSVPFGNGRIARLEFQWIPQDTITEGIEAPSAVLMSDGVQLIGTEPAVDVTAAAAPSDATQPPIAPGPIGAAVDAMGEAAMGAGGAIGDAAAAVASAARTSSKWIVGAAILGAIAAALAFGRRRP